jgi:hypothetical protein
VDKPAEIRKDKILMIDTHIFFARTGRARKENHKFGI